MDKGISVTCIELGPMSTLDLLLDLPAEIIELILDDLEPSDVLALRRTNRDLHNFIHQPESRVVKILNKKLWSKHDLNRRVTVPETVTLTDFFDVYRRHNAISLLSGTVADHVSQFCQRRVSDRIHIREERVRWRENLARKLQEQLTPALVMLDIFLGRLSEVFRSGEVRFEDYEDELYLRLGNIYQMDQVHILRDMKLSTQDVAGVTRAFAVLIGVLQAKKRSLDRVIEAVDMISLTVFIVEGLMPFRRCLDAESHYQGTSVLVAAAQCIQLGVPYEYGQGTDGLKSIPTIAKLGHRKNVRDRPQFLVRENDDVRNQMWSKQDVWVRAAATELTIRRRATPNSGDVRRWMVDVLSKDEEHDLFLKSAWDLPGS